MEFLHVDWLKQILAWQKPNGCYGQMKMSNFGKKYHMQEKADYVYDDQEKKHDKSKIDDLRIQQVNNNEAIPQGRNNDLQSIAKVGMSNNVVQQVVGAENKLQMKMTNYSATNVKPAVRLNNIVNVGAGQALPLHDLDIKPNDGFGNQQQNGANTQNNDVRRLPKQNVDRNGRSNLNNNQGVQMQNNMLNNPQLNMGGQIMGQNNARVLSPGPVGIGNNFAGGQVGTAPAAPPNRHDLVDPIDPQKWQRPFEQKKPRDYQDERIILRKLLVEKDLPCKY